MRKWSFLGAVFMQPHTAGRPSFRDTLLPGLPPPVYTFLLCDSSSVCSFSRCLSGFCLDLFCSVSPSWIIWDLHSNPPPPHSQDCWAVWKLPWPSTITTGTSVPAHPADQCACHLLPRPIHQVSSMGSLFSPWSVLHMFSSHQVPQCW